LAQAKKAFALPAPSAAMVDCRASLPQDMVGGAAVLPCARRNPCRAAAAAGAASLRRDQGSTLAGAPLRTLDMVPFSRTKPLSLGMARSRSTGVLVEGGTVDRALCLRTVTDLDLVINILTSLQPETRKKDVREFRRPFNPHREVVSDFLSEEQRRQQVLRALEKHPIVDIFDLARCSPRHWTLLSRELGGISHGDVMRRALECMRDSSTPLDRGAFWTAVGTRSKLATRSQTCAFAG